MNSILISLAIFASVAGLAHSNDLSHCELLSQSVNNMSGRKNTALIAYMDQNCPSEDLVRHMIYVKNAGHQGGLDIIFKTGKKQYRIYTEQKEEQAKWLAEAEAKVKEYYCQVEKLFKSPKTAEIGGVIEYPSTSAIDQLLQEVDKDNRNDGSHEFYLWSHGQNEAASNVKFMLDSLMNPRLLARLQS